MLRPLAFVSLLISLSIAASAPEAVTAVEEQTEQPQKNWFSRAFDSIEDSFKDWFDKIEKGFVKSVEETKTDGETGEDGNFANRTQEVIEINGKKFMRTKIIEQKVTNTSSSYREREVVRPLTPEEIQKLAPSA